MKKKKEIAKEKDIPWLEDEEYQKAVGQLRLQLNGIYSVFASYGMQVYIPQAIEETVKLCEDFGLRVRGIDHPISLEEVRRR